MNPGNPNQNPASNPPVPPQPQQPPQSPQPMQQPQPQPIQSQPQTQPEPFLTPSSPTTEPVAAPGWQPTAPTTPNTPSVEPPQQPTPSFQPPQETTPPPPPPVAFGGGAASAPIVLPRSKKPKGKMMRIIGVVLAALLFIGAAVWAVVAFWPQGAELEEFQGENYSLFVPVGYEREEVGQTMIFNKSADEDGHARSRVVVSTQPMSTIASYQSREMLIEQYDERLAMAEDDGAAGADEQGRALTMRNFTKSESDYGGFDARRVTYDTYAGEDQHLMHTTELTIFTEDMMYTVAVLASKGDSKLAGSANKIVTSLDIKS